MASIPPQLLKAMAARKTNENLTPPAKKKKAGGIPPQFANLRSKSTAQKETPQSNMFEDRFLQKNPSKQTAADKARLKKSVFAAAAQRKLGK